MPLNGTRGGQRVSWQCDLLHYQRIPDRHVLGTPSKKGVKGVDMGSVIFLDCKGQYMLPRQIRAMFSIHLQWVPQPPITSCSAADVCTLVRFLIAPSLSFETNHS